MANAAEQLLNRSLLINLLGEGTRYALEQFPESSYCNIISCHPVTTVVSNCSSSGLLVNLIASYAKDMVFGSDAVNGKKKQVVRADGQLEAFCKYCGYDEGLQFVPEVDACGKVVLLNDVEKEDTEDIGALPVPGLGRGWSDDKQMVAFVDCFEGTEKYLGGSKSVTSLESAGSYEEIRKSLAAHAKGKVSAKAFSGGIESKYARDIRDSQVTKSFYFAQTIELTTVRFQPSDYGIDALTTQGKKAYAKGPEEFRRVCGNRLITELHQGAALEFFPNLIKPSQSYKSQLLN